MRIQHLLTLTPLLLLIGSRASADAITGRVVDANGVGVAGVDIDFIRLGGSGNPQELNDGTDANGFFTTTCNPGIYGLLFFAPPPPTTTLLTGVLTPVSVSGTVNLGTITLVNGVSLQGTCKNAAAVPVAGIKIDVYDESTGELLHTKNNVTNAFGTFNMAVPKNTPLRAELLTSGVIGQVLVPREITGSLPANTNMGTLTFLTGFHVTGTAKRENGTNVFGADVDAIDVATGDTLFTPSDNTSTLGVFDVVVPAGGTFDFELIRPTGQVLVGVEVLGQTITAATNLGNLVMRNGVFLSGTVRDVFGLPVDGADVNVNETPTGLAVALGSDNTNVAGFYSVVVPLGTHMVTFSPPGPHTRFDKERRLGVVVAADTTLNARFADKVFVVEDHSSPASAGPVILPMGIGGGFGGHAVPHVGGRVLPAGAPSGATVVVTAPGASAPLVSAARLELELFAGGPAGHAELLIGTEHAVSPTGIQSVRPLARIPVTLDEQGSALLALPLGALPTGTSYAQLLVKDPSRAGFGLSHVLALEIPQ
jgi:hypothetical protein